MGKKENINCIALETQTKQIEALKGVHRDASLTSSASPRDVQQIFHVTN